MMKYYIEDYESCITYVHSTILIILTIILGAFGIIVWTCWDEQRIKKEVEAELANTKPEPLDVEEIPRKYLHFQKLCIKLLSDTISEDEFEFIIDELIEWMDTNNHPNFDDTFEIIKNMQNNENEDANSIAWLNTAILVWSTNPRWVMPYMKHTLPRNRSWTVS